MVVFMNSIAPNVLFIGKTLPSPRNATSTPAIMPSAVEPMPNYTMGNNAKA